jgi:hypothetical protein
VSKYKWNMYTVKPVLRGHFWDKPSHVVTSIKQSPVLKGHPFLVLS